MKWLIVMMVFISNFLYAQDRVGRVLKVTSSKKYALIKHLSSFDAQVGSLMNLESSSGENCPVKILKEMKNNRVIVNIKTCSFKKEIKRGDWLSRADAMMEDDIEDFEEKVVQKKRIVKQKGHYNHKNIYLLYNMANQFIWEGTDVSGGDYELTEDMSGTLGFGFEYYNMLFKRKWGYSVGIEYEMQREVSSAIDIDGNDETVEPATTYTFLNFFLNATYMMSKSIYFYGGGVLSLPGASNNLVEIGMGYGAQGGIGFVGDTIKLNLGYRMVGYSGTLSGNSGDIDATSTLSGLILNGGYTF